MTFIVGGQVTVAASNIAVLYLSALELPFYRRDLPVEDALTLFTECKRKRHGVDDKDGVSPVFRKPNLSGFIMRLRR
jgi:hypothetical protein